MPRVGLGVSGEEPPLLVNESDLPYWKGEAAVSYIRRMKKTCENGKLVTVVAVGVTKGKGLNLSIAAFDFEWCRRGGAGCSEVDRCGNILILFE